MCRDEAVQRCLNLIADLNQKYAWQLTPQVQQRYVKQIIACPPNFHTITDKKLAKWLSCYHTAHLFVKSLLDLVHPDHAEIWV
jgi:uncharacterized pyridoxal phosphate-containing UPF0001 family protein